MNVDYRYIAKAGTIGLLAALLVSQVKDLIQALADLKEVKKAEINRIEDVSESLAPNVKSRLNVLKLKPYYFQTQTKRIKIRSAQRYKFQPSDQKIVQDLQRQLSSQINQRRHQYKIPVKWYAKLEHPLKEDGRKYMQIQGFGEIKGDFFDVKRQYIPEVHLSYWQRFRNWIYQRIYKSSANIEESKVYSLFIGPVIGVLKYDINLMKDTNIIAVCNFQNGKIIPTVTATSKSEILTYYKNLINHKYIQVGALIVGTVFFGRWLLSDIRKELNAMKARRNKLNSKYFNMENLAQDKMCIICYNHVRNMIFFDCRHMIMCQECSETYDSDVCPYCKMEIDDIKPVIGIS